MATSQHTQLSLALQEEWRAVVGYEGAYEVSNRGRVRSIHGYHGIAVGRILKTRINHNGYEQVALRGFDLHYVHALVAAAFIGPRPAGWQVNHRNRQKADNALANLEYVTGSQNQRHARLAGFVQPRGSQSKLAKIHDDDVRAIRTSTEPLAVLAARYSVSMALISGVRRRKLWAHVPDTEGGG